MPITFPINFDGRCWSVQYERGDVFKDGTSFDGVTLKLELKSLEEAKKIAALLLWQSKEGRQNGC